MLAFSNDYYGLIFRATQSVELFCAYRDNLTKEEILQDDRFFCIAGYTSGGAPYGVTWEEKDLKPWEDWEENE